MDTVLKIMILFMYYGFMVELGILLGRIVFCLISGKWSWEDTKLPLSQEIAMAAIFVVALGVFYSLPGLVTGLFAACWTIMYAIIKNQATIAQKKIKYQ